MSCIPVHIDGHGIVGNIRVAVAHVAVVGGGIVPDGLDRAGNDGAGTPVIDGHFLADLDRLPVPAIRN